MVVCEGKRHALIFSRKLVSNRNMRCPQCQRKFQDRKALLCHMNHPSVSCRSHFQEVINFADELWSYQGRRAQDQSFPPDDFTPPTTPEPMDIEAAVEESFQEDSQNVDSGPFIEEYVGAAKKYGRGTTFMESVTLKLSVTRLGYVLRRAGCPWSIPDNNKALASALEQPQRVRIVSQGEKRHTWKMKRMRGD